MPKNKNKEAIKSYYLDSRESRWGYKYLLKGTKHYGYYPKGKKLTIAQAQLEMETQIGKTLDLPKGSYILDAGCGEGWVALHLAQKFGFRINGIDLLEYPSIAEANKRKKDQPKLDLEFSEMDFSDLKFEDNTFDGIYTIETLVHSPDFQKTLKEFHRVLKPGGILVNFEYAMDDEMPKSVEEVWRFIYKRGSMHTLGDFRMNRMADNWQAAGFENVRIRDITLNIRPFMKFLYRTAIIPFTVLKAVGKEKNYLNTYVGVKSYQNPQKETFHYLAVRAQKQSSY